MVRHGPFPPAALAGSAAVGSPGRTRQASGATAAPTPVFLDAACIAQRATGVPIITHTQDGVCGPEQQDAFRAGGVELHRCLIGHCCGNADPGYHRRVCEGGSYIGFDRIGLTRSSRRGAGAPHAPALPADRSSSFKPPQVPYFSGLLTA